MMGASRKQDTTKQASQYVIKTDDERINDPAGNEKSETEISGRDRNNKNIVDKTMKNI